MKNKALIYGSIAAIIILFCIFIEINETVKKPLFSELPNIKTEVKNTFLPTDDSSAQESGVLSEQSSLPNSVDTEPVTSSYIGNKSTKKLHRPECSSVKMMNESNKDYLNCTRDEAIAKGYKPCKRCNVK